MKKNILSLAALLIASATMFTACSSSDDSIISENQQPVQTTGKYTMTIQASKGDGASTRALTLDGKTLNATWDANEVVLVYQGGSQIGTLRSAASTTSATTLTGTLDSAPDADQDLTLYFHTKATPSYTGQDGKLATIASTYDFCAPATITAGSFTVSGNTVSTTGSVSFGANRQFIVKFTLKDKNSETLLNAGTVRVQATAYGDSEIFDFVFTIPDGTYTTNGDGVIYLAIPNIGSYLSKQASQYSMSLDAIKSSYKLNITATVGDDTYTYTKSGWPFEDGKYYEITVKMNAPAPAYTLLSAATTSDYGKVVCADGHLHDAKTAVPAGCTAVGILGKVTETGHGLILALQDATSQTWNTINDWPSVDKYAGTTLKLLPDDAALGSLTSFEKLGDTYVSNWAVAQKSDYDAIFHNLGSTRYDSDGYTYDFNVNDYITIGVGGTAIDGEYWSATEYGGGPAYFFYYECWSPADKTTSFSVRPVLAF